MSLSVAVITPEHLVQQTTADGVYVPAWDGELGVLTNHLPLLAQLKAGEVRLVIGDKTEVFAISGGFIEVRKNNVAIFAESAEDAAEIDIERARQAAERARQQLRARTPDIELGAAEGALQRALIRLRVAESSQRRSGTRRPPTSIN